MMGRASQFEDRVLSDFQEGGFLGMMRVDAVASIAWKDQKS